MQQGTSRSSTLR